MDPQKQRREWCENRKERNEGSIFRMGHIWSFDQKLKHGAQSLLTDMGVEE